MRVSVQLRFAPNGARWTKSVYLDTTEQEIALSVPAMVAADRPAGTLPDLSNAQSILFVVDLVNARPGDSGAFTITGLHAVPLTGAISCNAAMRSLASRPWRNASRSIRSASRLAVTAFRLRGSFGAGETNVPSPRLI